MVNLRTRKTFPKGTEIAEVHASLKSGPILGLASKGPIVIYPTTTVKDACGVMVDNGIRRVPVVDSGTNKLEGIVRARDLVDFFGGGQKYNIVKKEYKGNLFAAISLPVSKIMESDVVSLGEGDSIRKAAKTLLESDVGGCPVVDKWGKVIAIVSEGDFIKNLHRMGYEVRVGDIMSKEVVSVTPGMSIGDAAKIMMNKGKRRLPVVHDTNMVGMLRTTSILRFISSNEFARFGTVNADEILERGKVGEAMSEFFLTMSPDDSVEHLIDVMLARRLGGFPVKGDHKLVGMVTEHDVFRFAYSWALK